MNALKLINELKDVDTSDAETFKWYVVNCIKKYYCETLKLQHALSEKDNVGGQIRSLRGRMVEDIGRIAWEGLQWFFTSCTLTSKKGTDDKIEITSKNGFTKLHKTDKHNYVNDELINVMECKAYLDSCYYERACSDLMLFRNLPNKSINRVVIALEDGIFRNTQLFYDDIFDCPVNKVFFLVDGKRCSSKPLYVPRHRKELNAQKVYELVDYCFQLISKSQTT
jgi:hypothetical protein